MMSRLDDLRHAEISDLAAWLGERRQAISRGLASLALVALLLVGGYWWFVVRWRPPPSIFDSPVDNVLGYLAMDDFSRLPLKDRLEFLMGFADRFRSMAASDSALAAAFLAGLGGPAKEQLRQNARFLARDILLEGAGAYVNLPADQKGKFIDDWVLGWMKKAELMATGKERDETDEERLADLKGQSSRQEKRMAERPQTIPGLDSGSALRFLDFCNEEVGQTTSPKEQGQIARFLDDVRSRFSGAF